MKKGLKANSHSSMFFEANTHKPQSCNRLTFDKNVAVALDVNVITRFIAVVNANFGSRLFGVFNRCFYQVKFPTSWGCCLVCFVVLTFADGATEIHNKQSPSFVVRLSTVSIAIS